VPAWAGFPDPPGGHLVDDGIWRVGHGPTPYWPAGTLLIESQRHFLDYADFTPEEAASLGPLIRQFTAPLKEATGAQRIHVFSSMEGTEHFHLWMVPRTGDVQSGRAYLADPGYCTEPAAEAVISRVRQIMRRAGADG
jgi:diadenosine tetraphosphate (Ap4A) HIT family hydrolase